MVHRPLQKLGSDFHPLCPHLLVGKYWHNKKNKKPERKHKCTVKMGKFVDIILI